MTTTTTSPYVELAQRFDLEAVAPDGLKAVFGLERYVRSNVDAGLFHLVKLRASIINGCAFCVDMHAVDSVSAGEHPRRLYAVAAWHESSMFTAAERTALALTDAVTKIADGGVPDELWAEAVATFGEKTAVDLLLAIATINVWNRVSITRRSQTPPL